MSGSGEQLHARVPVYHLITPGDHFSPRTGSAIPTVVHGLAGGAAVVGDTRRYPQFVVLQGDTFQPRYDSAEAVEYEGVSVPSSKERAIDAALARVGRPRRATERYFRPAAERLRDADPGIVLAHNAPLVPWLLRDQNHLPVLYAHNDVLRSYSRAESSRILGHATRIVCVSESLATEIRAHLPRSLHDRVRVVVNGVDVEQFTPSKTRAPGPLRVMFLGRAIPDKGADILLEAAGLLDRTDLEYVIVGSHGFDPNAQLSSFERRLRELTERVNTPVHFEPFVDRQNLPPLLQRADVLVIPSRWSDPCPLTVGEGMASGLPIVASRRGGIPELLGHAGILFDPDDPSALASALRSLADEPDVRAELSQAAVRRARARDWSWAWAHLADVLDEMGGRS
jgi:glycosyltransferase involved in cell wall biosynthesis